MKKRISHLIVVTLCVVVGCSQGTPGGPGMIDKSTPKPVFGQIEDTFTLSVPVVASKVQQGEKTEVAIGIKRARNFDEDVSLRFEKVPAGVIIEPENPVIKHGDSETKLTFVAGEEAVTGDYKIKVSGHPKKGADATVDFKLKVADRDSFSLNVPRFSLKQGEIKTVRVTIDREKKFDQDVSVTFAEMPNGVTIEPTTLIIKGSDTNADMTLTAAADAALGDFEIKMVGRPPMGKDSSNELKFSIIKK